MISIVSCIYLVIYQDRQGHLIYINKSIRKSVQIWRDTIMFGLHQIAISLQHLCPGLFVWCSSLRFIADHLLNNLFLQHTNKNPAFARPLHLLEWQGVALKGTFQIWASGMFTPKLGHIPGCLAFQIFFCQT